MLVYVKWKILEIFIFELGFYVVFLIISIRLSLEIIIDVLKSRVLKWRKLYYVKENLKVDEIVKLFV